MSVLYLVVVEQELIASQLRWESLSQLQKRNSMVLDVWYDFLIFVLSCPVISNSFRVHNIRLHRRVNVRSRRANYHLYVLRRS